MSNSINNIETYSDLDYYKRILQVGAICKTLWIPYLAIVQGNSQDRVLDIIFATLLWLFIYWINQKSIIDKNKFNIGLLILGSIVVFTEFETYVNFSKSNYLYLTASMTTYFFAVFLQQTKKNEGIIATLIILNSLRLPDHDFLFTMSCVTFCFAVVYAKTLLTNHIQNILQQKENQAINLEKEIKQKHIETISQISKKVSHEVNNQLSEVSCGADLLEILLDEHKFHKENPEVMSIILAIQRQAQKTSGMIKNLAKIGDFKNIKLESISCMEFNYKIEEMIKKFSKIKSEKLHQIKIEFNQAPLQNFISTSLHDLEFILFNILENAVYSLNEVESKTISIKLKEDLNNKKIALVMSNNGPKINDKISTKLFKEFVSDKDIQEGSGISLFISNMLVSELGGRINLSQNKDNLVEFTIEFDTFEPVK
jgi:K+-sensing histidine kinase KdpD